jgi:hypothetical protein
MSTLGTGAGFEHCTKQASPLSRITSGPILGLAVDNLCLGISWSCWYTYRLSCLGEVLTANVKKRLKFESFDSC